MDALERVTHKMALHLVAPGVFSNVEADKLLNWFKLPRASYDDLPDALAQKVADHFGDTDMEGNDISHLPDHEAAREVRLSMIAKIHAKVDDVMKEERIVEDRLNSLDHLSFTLEIVQALKITIRDASILLNWVLDDDSKQVFDMSDDAVQKVIDKHYPEHLDGSPLRLDLLKDAVRKFYHIPEEMPSGFADI